MPEGFNRKAQALELAVGDQRNSRSRAEFQKLVDELKEKLRILRKDGRAAALASKRRIDAQRGGQREELLGSAAMQDRRGVDEKAT